MEPTNVSENMPEQPSEDTTTTSPEQSSSSPPSEEVPLEEKVEERSRKHRRGRQPTDDQKSKLSKFQRQRAAEIRLLCEYYACDWPTAQLRHNDLKSNGQLQDVLTKAAAGQRDVNAPVSRCPRCGNKLLKRDGRFGPFIGCVGYPECRFTRPVEDGNIKPTAEAMEENVARMQLTTKFIQDIGGTELALKWIGICIQGLSKSEESSSDNRTS